MARWPGGHARGARWRGNQARCELLIHNREHANTCCSFLLCGFAIVLLGFSSAESDPVIAILTPRACAADSGRGPNLHLAYTRPPCVPRCRERKKKPSAGGEKLVDVPKRVHLIHLHIYGRGGVPRRKMTGGGSFSGFHPLVCTSSSGGGGGVVDVGRI